MSAAATARITRGYSQIPNSLIENQKAFTHAEFALATCVLRRGGAESAITISSRTWEAWTGLSPRLKEYAVAGLKAKGLAIAGRGDTARLRFQVPEWEHFVRNREASKPRTAGRSKGVAPHQGAKIHPTCRERGCQLLNQSASDLSLVSVTPDPQPVARTQSGNGTAKPAAVACTGTATGPRSASELKLASRVFGTRNAQPVAQTPDVVELAWSQTLAAIQAIFPMVGVAFLVRLLAVVRQAFANVQDRELAQAVNLAYRKKRSQESEGLFLLTVPEALAVMRKQPAPAAAPDTRADALRLLLRMIEAARARGAPLADLTQALSDLHAQVGSGLDLIYAEQHLEGMEPRIIAAAAATLSQAQRAKIDAHVESSVKPYRTRRRDPLFGPALDQLREHFRKAEILATLGLPRFTLAP